MFRNLARLMPARANVFDVHPLQLSRWLDEAWAQTATVPVLGPASSTVPLLGSDQIIGAIDLPTPTARGFRPIPSGIDPSNPDRFTGQPFQPTQIFQPQIVQLMRIGLIFDQLIYAYLVESTGVFEVIAEVLRRYVVGETLPPLTPPAARWARSTEELFFRDPPLYAIQGTVSELRPDQRVARRNAYWRMFGLEPPHPIPKRWARSGSDGSPWRLDTGDGVNTGFRDKWVELLRQIWLGIENANNGIGPNSTDPGHIGLLCRYLRDMMAMRRRQGLLAREEFVYVTTLSWFHLTVDTNESPIVQVLNAQGPDPADRLAKIAQHVGMAPAPSARDLFALADLMPTFLRTIELGLFDTGPAAQMLYLNMGTNTALLADVNEIINRWQSATGDRVKERPAGTTAQPIPLSQLARPSQPAPAVHNGHG